MKKLSPSRSLLLIWIFGLSGWMGCTPSPSSPSQSHTQEIVLKVWHAYRGEERQQLDFDLKQFTQKTGIQVRSLPLPYNAFANKIQVAIPRGNGPDVFIFAHDRVGDWAESGLIEPVGFWMTPQLDQAYFRSSLDALSYQGNLFGLPLSCKTLVLYYHKDLVKTPPKETQEWVDLIKTLRASEAHQKVWGLGVPEIDSLYFHAPWIHGFGGQILDEQGSPFMPLPPASTSPRSHSSLLIASSEVQKSMLLLKKWQDQLKMMPRDMTSDLVSEQFRNGQMAFVINGPWFKGDLGQMDPQKWGIAPLPKVSETQKPLRPFLGVEGVMLSSRSKHPQQAWKLMQWLASKESAQRRMSQGQLVAHAHVYAEAPQSDEWINTFKIQFEQTVPLSNAPMMKRMWTPLKRALSQVILFGGSAHDAVNEAQMQIRKAIGLPSQPASSSVDSPKKSSVHSKTPKAGKE